MSENAGEKMSFQTEVSQLLHLMIHSLYSHKEIFLRELISNAADAIDKARFTTLSDPSALGDDKDFAIDVKLDKKAGTVTVSDNGIGMDRDELIQNLGTIARSGTKAFVQGLSGDQAKDMSLIGQFGVGFYSAFMVADEVTVTSRRLGSDSAWKWTSEGTGDFTIAPAEKESRGTEIVLHLRKEEEDYLEDWTVRDVVRKYSEFVSWPLRLTWEKTTTEGEGDDRKEKSETVTETLNSKPALWRQSPSSVTEEQYKEFYHHISRAPGDPLLWTHTKVEGTNEFSVLAYVPSKAPYGIFQTDFVRGVKLYVKRVFVMDEAKELLPTWLRFVQGVVDSEDLPLNVSREILQDNKQVDAIRKHLTKKVLESLQKFSEEKPDEYAAWWRELGSVLKEGFYMNWQFLDELKALLRFGTTFADAKNGLTSLKEYVSRMPESQKEIYVLTGESPEAVKHSPHLEALEAKGYEVLLMTDPVDEWMLQFLREFDGKRFRNIAEGDLDLADASDKKKTEEAEKGPFAGVLAAIKERMKESLSEVRLTSLLKDSPSRLVSDAGSMSLRMEQRMKSFGGEQGLSKRILELNPEHPVCKHLLALGDDKADEKNDWYDYLYDQALIAEGADLPDPGSYVKLVNRLLAKGF